MKFQLNFIIFFFIVIFTRLNTFAQCPPVDTLPPTIFAPPDLVLSNDLGSCSATISASTLSYPVFFDICGVSSVLPSFPPAANYTFPVGVTIVTWTATDTSGNSSTADQTVTVIDDEIPQLVCASSITVNTNPGDCDAYVNVPLPNVVDNCAIDTTTNSINGNGLDASGIFPVGVTTVIYEVTDTSNNVSQCSIDITVVNNQIPVINLLGNTSITLEACDSYTEQGATAIDSCLGDISDEIVIDSSSLDTSTLGVYLIYYNVVDDLGQIINQEVRTINVIDTTSPSMVLIGPNPLNIGDCSTYVELGAEATDPCFGDISGNIVIDNSSVNSGVLGSYNVTYNVTDNSGNTTSQITRVVNVIEVTAPIINLIGDNPQIIEVCSNYNELGATAVDPCFNDDYSGDIAIDASTVDTNTVGTYYVSYNVSDVYGNAAIEIVRTVEVVDTTPPTLSLIGDNPQIISACTPYIELGVTAIDCNSIDYTNDIIIDTSSINVNVEGVYPVNYSVCDVYGNCTGIITRDIQVVLSNPSANAGNDVTNNICTDTTINLSANAVIGSESSGIWTVTSGQTSRFSFSDPTSPTSTFTGDVGETYTLTWTIDNPSPCEDVSDSIQVNFIRCSTIDFDGNNDNITFRDNYNLNSNFTIEVWIKSETQNNDIQTIFSKRETNNLVDGYDLRIVNNYVSFNWNNGESLEAPHQINTNQWHHLAVSNNSGTYTLYIDGLEMNSTTGSIPVSNSADCLLGAMDQNITPPYKPKNYFDGGMDELRIWDVALTTSQIRKMMNQEIQEDNASVKGTVIPISVSGLTWSNVLGYYRMNQNNDLENGELIANNGSGTGGLLRYMTSLQEETAPLPHQTIADGNWSNTSTWLNGSVQAIPNSIGIDGTTSIDWNIVKTLHNISSGDINISLLGLKVNSNKLTIENTDVLDGQSIRITDYLYIDGVLDLVGESQLLQDANSIVDYSGTGSLKRDQQGTTNFYNYNYWSSPVGSDGINYILENTLYDGSQPVLWTSEKNANPATSPITLSNYWLYLYENFPANSYADWQQINESNTIPVGLGYIMKGSGSADSEQNYTFKGQPNNGLISTPITANYGALVGNPYPSAIDANAFINDNNSSILGTLYFWEHYDSNATHILEEYEGGYATYNLTGGNPAVSPSEISQNGTPVKIPERYIPVAQGFFVEANATGGQVVFNNDQRIFAKESVTGASNNGSVFFREATTNASLETTNEDFIQRVRLNCTSPDGSIRHLLLGFTPDNAASDAFDYGYDALNTESFPNDMFWMIEEEKYIIQGVGAFNDTKTYPIGVFLTSTGTIDIALQELENFETEIEVFIYDALLDTYHQIDTVNSFTTYLESDEYLDRFFIAFTQDTTLSNIESQLEDYSINYLNNSKEIYIQLPLSNQLQNVHLFNSIGQRITTWHFNKESGEVKIPVTNVAEGVYIVKVESSIGTLSEKIIISD